MNCPKCGGTGYVPTNVFGVNGAIKCDFCDGTGVFITNNEEPQTGQEWLQTATTEQLAEFISKIDNGGFDTQFRLLYGESNEVILQQKN